MPAAAVIPAPIAYIKVVAVKKLVVGFLVGATIPELDCSCNVLSPAILVESVSGINLLEFRTRVVYCEKIRVFKAGNWLEYISME